MRNIFITGVTGFLGAYLLKFLLDDNDIAPIVLVRGKHNETATERIENVLKYLYGQKEYKLMLGRVRICEGEIDKSSLGIDSKSMAYLIEETDEIFHSAAIAEFRVPLDTIRTVNVGGTENILKFALECKKRGRLRKFNHISTAYVAGSSKTVFYENNLVMGQGFNNTYEQSKYEAELLVHYYEKMGLEVSIFRPSTLTGDTIIGKTSNFKMLYQPLHFLAAELFDAIPANRMTRANLIPVDCAAKEILLIANNKGSAGKTFNIVNPLVITAGHFFEVAGDFFGFRLPKFIPFNDFNIETLSDVQKVLIEPFIPYLNKDHLFDLSNCVDVLNDDSFHCQEIDDKFLIKLFEFCEKSKFIKPKKRHVNVFR